MVEDLSREDMVRCIDQAVEELLAQASIESPPVDAMALTRHLGLPLDERSRRGRGARAGRARPSSEDQALPAVTTEEQKQWAAAWAIGEHRKPELLERLGFAPGEKKPMLGESLAGLFARHLLVPSAWLAADARSCGHDLLRLKERYGTASDEVIAFRLLDLPEPCIITVVLDDKVHRRRSNAWPVKKRLEPAEVECLKAVTRDGQPHCVRSGVWTVWGWPMWRAGRNREILRSVVDGDALGAV